MVKRILFCRLLFSCFLLAQISVSYADRRSYVWTYEYKTMPRGELEIEYYHTLEYPNTSNPKVSTWKQNVEAEYGISDRWDVGIYQNFKQSNTATANTFSYDGWKLRTRYRIGERDLFLVDPLLYFELQGPNDLSSAAVFEGKVILAKDWERFNLSYNQIFKQTLRDGIAPQQEYAAGISFEFKPTFKLGLEGKGNYTTARHYVGPTISFAAEKIWVNFGLVVGLGNSADQLQSRLLAGIFI